MLIINYIFFHVYYFLIFVGSAPRHIRIAERIRTFPCKTLREGLDTPLPFRIPVVRQEFVDLYPSTFELGICEYTSHVDTWLDYMTTGQSEHSVVGVDSLWMVVMDACIPGISFYRDQKDKSSQLRLRSDCSMFLNGAIFAKAEEKASIEDMASAATELSSKFNSTARRLFPLNCNEICGITSSKDLIQFHIISSVANRFMATIFRSYDLKRLDGRVHFIRDLIGMMRYVCTIAGPHEAFHLIPDVRRGTTNGHHVTWTVHGLLKEFHHISSTQMERISYVYNLRLPNVECGIVVNNNSIYVQRVGYTLSNAIMIGIIKREVALEQVCGAVDQLHSHGLAHCDICAKNVFVDLDPPYSAFLDDLEYLTPLDDTAPKVANHPNVDGVVVTARQLDQYQLNIFAREIMML